MIDAKGFQAKLESTALRNTEESTMVGDVSTADSDFPENELLLRQLIFADRILINKVDLLPAEGPERQATINKIMQAIERVNTQADVQ